MGTVSLQLDGPAEEGAAGPGGKDTEEGPEGLSHCGTAPLQMHISVAPTDPPWARRPQRNTGGPQTAEAGLTTKARCGRGWSSGCGVLQAPPVGEQASSTLSSFFLVQQVTLQRATTLSGQRPQDTRQVITAARPLLPLCPRASPPVSSSPASEGN